MESQCYTSPVQEVGVFCCPSLCWASFVARPSVGRWASFVARHFIGRLLLPVRLLGVFWRLQEARCVSSFDTGDLIPEHMLCQTFSTS